jgi:biotin carboxyl carrier protein
MKYVTTVDGTEYVVELLPNRRVSVNGQEYAVNFEEVEGHLIYTLLVDGRSFEAHISQDDDLYKVLIQGTLYSAEVIDEREKRLREAGGEVFSANGDFVLVAPMPGLVVKLPVKAGDQVETGDVLVILESMKMQNELKSPQAGTVSEVYVEEGASVEKRDELMVIEPGDEEASG